MDAMTWNLLGAAAGVGLIHTALGPDHYVPFVMLANRLKLSSVKSIRLSMSSSP